ncbi:MAG TPA: hypothetical protein PKE06_14840 [Flavilitoribacter sp.]|nr:hypothetical protein [Flavilitoribacter sp.]HMQ88685.1 hypothetical protein [Flavilitoribacter sp.]
MQKLNPVMIFMKKHLTMPLLPGFAGSRGIVGNGDILVPVGIEKRRSDFDTRWCGVATVPCQPINQNKNIK